jgi:hypothetical protein
VPEIIAAMRGRSIGTEINKSMCGRFSVSLPPDEVARYFQITGRLPLPFGSHDGKPLGATRDAARPPRCARNGSNVPNNTGKHGF